MNRFCVTGAYQPYTGLQKEFQQEPLPPQFLDAPVWMPTGRHFRADDFYCMDCRPVSDATLIQGRY